MQVCCVVVVLVAKSIHKSLAWNDDDDDYIIKLLCYYYSYYYDDYKGFNNNNNGKFHTQAICLMPVEELKKFNFSNALSCLTDDDRDGLDDYATQKHVM